MPANVQKRLRQRARAGLIVTVCLSCASLTSVALAQVAAGAGVAATGGIATPASVTPPPAVSVPPTAAAQAQPTTAIAPGSPTAPGLSVALSQPAQAGTQPLPANATVAGGNGSDQLSRVNLQQAIDIALQRASGIDIAKLEVARANALVREARAAMFPTLIGNATYTRLDNDRVLNNNTIAGQDQLSANLVLSLPLVAAQRWVQKSHASDNVKVAELRSGDVRRQIAVAVAHAYLSVVAAHRNIEVDQRALDNAKAHYDYAHTRFAGGVGNRLDDVRADQEVATSDAQLQSARAALTRSEEALGILLGVDGAVEVSDDVSLPAGPDLAQGLSEAVATRNDVRANQARVKADQKVVDDDWADYMPVLLAQFQPFYQNPASLTQPKTGWQAQLILSVPFYDGGLRYGLQDERDAIAAESRTQLEATLRQVKSEVRVAFSVVQSADAALVSATKGAQLASQALEMANLAYRAGATGNLEVIDAERRARDAETAAVIAEDTARQARLDLLAATGRLQ